MISLGFSFSLFVVVYDVYFSMSNGIKKLYSDRIYVHYRPKREALIPRWGLRREVPINIK
jgi:hypothetical protein